MDVEEENIKDYYLDKKISKKINLETIYEESDNTSDDTGIHMSVKRFKRTLLFSPTVSKVKKRRAKIKKVFGSNMWHKRENILKNYTETLRIIKEKKPFIIDKELLEKIDKELFERQSSSCV